MGDERNRTTKDDEADHAYQLDLDEHAASDLEGAFEEAVAAVAGGVRGEGQAVKDGGSKDGEPGEGLAWRELKDKLERAEAERNALRDRLQRTLADFDNFRKRTEREKASLAQMGIFEVVKDFLGVTDNLERAMAASGSIDDLKQGLELVMRQQGEILRRHGVVSVAAVGQPFDPMVHEAVTREESDEVDGPTVCDELQKGYLLYDRLLRPAMVRVAVPKVSPSAGDAGSGGDDPGEEDAEE